MVNFTSNTYQMKREILSFSNKISKHLSKPDKKFSADMTYGMLAAGSCLLTDVVEQLHEDTKKVNSVERLTRHLNNGTSFTALKSYLTAIRKWAPQEPVIYIDDSDVVKPDGYKFEALGLVRDGSKSTASKTVYEKGYHVTEACVLTKNNHPVSIFSKIHSSKETSVYKGYKQDKIEMRGDRAEMSDFPLYLNTVAGGLDRRDQTIGGFSFVVKIYAVPVVEIIG